MGAVQLPHDLKQVIDRQVAEGRVASEAEFLAQAVHRYAAALEWDGGEIAVAADEGITDIADGRFELIADPEDIRRRRGELAQTRDELAARHGSARARRDLDKVL
jgi:Arc/MetJ-type ribon-helix-helix transcriptional regulator